MHRLPRGPGAGSSNRRRDRRRVPVHLSSPVARSRPSNTPSDVADFCHFVLMSSRFTKKSLVSVPGRLVKTPCADRPTLAFSTRRPPMQHRHLGRGQRQQLRPIHQQLRRRSLVLLPQVVAEPVGGRLQHGERVHVGLLLRRIHAPRREGNLHVVPGLLRRFLDRRAAAQNDQVGKRDLLAAGLRALNSFWIASSFCSTFASSAGWLTSQSFCGARRMRAPLAPPRLSLPRNVDADAQAVVTSCGDGQAGGEDLRLQGGDVLLPDQRMIHGGDRVLPRAAAPSERAGRDSARSGPCRGASA